jgi:phosphatidate cytidylyltransferase
VLGVSGLLLSVISQIGDLIASLIKREHDIKDFGTIFPGHGGVMDRFDSILPVSASLFIICYFFPPFF